MSSLGAVQCLIACAIKFTPILCGYRYSFYNVALPVVDIMSSVGDPDLQDPHVFGPSGSISQRYGSGSGSRSSPFLIKELSRVK